MYILHKKSDSLWRDVLMLFCTMWIGGMIGECIMYVLLKFPCQIIRPTTNYRQFLLIYQAIISTSIFIIGPLCYWLFLKKKLLRHFIAGEQRYGYFLLLTTALMLVAMLVNTFFVYWNLQLKFPSWLAAFEHWAQAKEASLKNIVSLMTTFASWKDLLIAIIVIGFIPAIGEELVFRGILQPMLARYTHHIHVAIWGIAFLFSAIHLQIYGFLPRLLLGALLGYLCAWTKNLIYPIMAHFFNNSLTLILAFMQQHTSYQFSEESKMPSLPLLITSTCIGVLLMVHIYKLSTKVVYQ